MSITALKRANKHEKPENQDSHAQELFCGTSRLRIWRHHCSSPGHCCGTGSLPNPGASTCHRCGKINKQTTIIKTVGKSNKGKTIFKESQWFKESHPAYLVNWEQQRGLCDLSRVKNKTVLLRVTHWLASVLKMFSCQGDCFHVCH